MTPEELQEVVAAVIAALKTNGKTIDQLTAVTSLADTDNLEISNGKKVSFGKLKELVANAVVVSAEEIKGWEIIDSTDDLPEDPTQVQQEKAYVLADVSTMYVYVGTGGDTLDGKYRSVQLKGDKGDKGDSGVDLGEVVLVNDLTTGGEESALTAEMGKLVNNKLFNILAYNDENDMTKKAYINSSGVVTTNNNCSYLIREIPAGTKSIIVAFKRASYDYESIVFYDSNDVFVEQFYYHGTGVDVFEVKPNYAKVGFSVITADHTFKVAFHAENILTADEKTWVDQMPTMSKDLDIVEGFATNIISTKVFSDLTDAGYYDSSGVYHANANLHGLKMSIPSGATYFVCKTGTAADIYENICFYDASDNFIESFRHSSTGYDTFKFKLNYSKIAFSCYNAKKSNFSAAFVSSKITDEALPKAISSEIIDNPKLPYCKAVRDVMVVGREDKDTPIFFQSIWKNYPSAGSYFVSIYRKSNPIAAEMQVTLTSPQEVIEGNLSGGGKIRIAMDWDAVPDGYYQDNTGDVMVIPKSRMYNDGIEKSNEASLRDAIFAQDIKNPFAWKDFEKAYLTLMNDGCRDDMNLYRLQCEQRGVPYVCTMQVGRMDNVLTFTDVDGNGIFVARRPRLGVEYTTDISNLSTTPTKLRLYLDTRSELVGTNVSMSIKLYTNATTYTTEQVQFSNAQAGKTYANITLTGIVKVGVILAPIQGKTHAELCNIMLTPYEQTSNNTEKTIAEIARIMYNNFGEVMLHGTKVINSNYDDVAERMMYEQYFENKAIVEEKIGIHCIKGLVPIGGTNSNYWHHTELGQKFMLRNYLYCTQVGTTPQYEIQRFDDGGYYNKIVYLEIATGLLSVGSTYYYDATHFIRVYNITTDGSTDKVLAYTNNYTSSAGNVNITIPASGSLYTSSALSTLVGAFANGRVATTQETAETYASMMVANVIIPAIANNTWIIEWCHSETPPEAFGALIDAVKALNNYGTAIQFSDWYGVWNEYKSSEYQIG